jgi:nicotinamide riboside transporter PnuC
MVSKAAVIEGIATVTGITMIVLLQREDPISPSRMGR